MIKVKQIKLYIIIILLVYSTAGYAMGNSTTAFKQNSNYVPNALSFVALNSDNNEGTTKPVNTTSNNTQPSKRASGNSSDNNKVTPPFFDPYKPQAYPGSQPAKTEKSITGNIFEQNDNNYIHHTFRVPMVNINLDAKQGIDNGNDINITSKGRSQASVSASYLYSLAKGVKLGPEVMHTTYNNRSNIEVNDSFSLMLRGEVTLYQNQSFELYALAGAGISFNRLNLIYTRVSISKDKSKDAYTEYIVKPIINGSSVPDKTPYFYCGTYARFNNLDYDVFPDPDDQFKGTSAFKGDGFGTCVYSNSDNSKNYTVSYQDFLIPKTATSIPWFVGLGVDYSLNPFIAKLMQLTPIDASLPQTSSIGISFNTRYFDNGTSRVQYEQANGVDQYTVSYKGYLSFSVSLYLKI